MKTFYTERDIEDMFAAGVKEIAVDDNTVLTDIAREKVDALGMKLSPATARNDQAELLLKNLSANLPAPASPAVSPAPTFAKAAASISINTPLTDTELVERIKSGVIAKIGTTDYNDLLDQIIPQVLAQYIGSSKSGQTPQSNSDY